MPTIDREDVEEQNGIPDQQDALRPHCQRTDLEEDWINLL